MALYSSSGSSIDSLKGKDVSTKLGLNVVVNFKGVFYSAFGSALQMPDTMLHDMSESSNTYNNQIHLINFNIA